MNIIEELEEVYQEINNSYSREEFEARSRGYNRKEERIQYKRYLNDHSYFLLAFTRLERKIKKVGSELIENKSNNLTSWSYKRVWEILKKHDNNSGMHFMDYVELLTVKGHTDYNLINDYYEDRNKVAHGGTLDSINMNDAFADFYRLFKQLN